MTKQSPLFKNLLIFILPLLIITACSNKEATQQRSFTPKVTVKKVKSKKVQPSHTYVGETVAKSKVKLRARIKGFLEHQNFNDGDYVKEGRLLFSIEKEQYKAEVNTAKSNLKEAQAEFENAKSNFNRYQFLSKQKAVPEKRFQEARKNKKVAKAKILRYKAQLRKVKRELSYTDIHAPFDGKIGLAEYTVGNIVSSSSKPLATIVKLDPIKVSFHVSESEVLDFLQNLHKTKKDNNLTTEDIKSKEYVIPKLILSNNSMYPYKGDIVFIDNKVDPQTGTIKMQALFPNPNYTLLPGAFVRIKLLRKKKIETLLVPQKSLLKEQAGTYVFIVNKDNKVEKRSIKIGDIYNKDVSVKKGLKQGELVITEGLQKVKRGSKVKYNKLNDSKSDKKNQKNK